MLDCEFLGLTCAEGRNRTLTKTLSKAYYLHNMIIIIRDFEK